MSAYVVEREHIAYLIEAALSEWAAKSWGAGRFIWPGADGHEHTLTRANVDDVGQMLWDENMRSVGNRYPDCALDELPGQVLGDPVYRYTHPGRLWNRIEPAQVVKSCDCYEYQTCEPDDWPETEAFQFIQALRTLAGRSVDGYAKGVWGAPKPDVLAFLKGGV